MKIVKQPIKPTTKDPLYEVQCPLDRLGCGALLQFRRSEIIRIRDQHDGDAEYIICPCCGKTIWNTHFGKFRIVEE